MPSPSMKPMLVMESMMSQIVRYSLMSTALCHVSTTDSHSSTAPRCISRQPASGRGK